MTTALRQTNPFADQPARDSSPDSHLARIKALDLIVITYRHAFADGRSGEGAETCHEVLPRDVIGPHATLITFRVAERAYDIAGYEVYRRGAAGGRYASIHGALDWIEWCDRQQAHTRGEAA